MLGLFKRKSDGARASARPIQFRVTHLLLAPFIPETTREKLRASPLRLPRDLIGASEEDLAVLGFSPDADRELHAWRAWLLDPSRTHERVDLDNAGMRRWAVQHMPGLLPRIRSLYPDLPEWQEPAWTSTLGDALRPRRLFRENRKALSSNDVHAIFDFIGTLGLDAAVPGIGPSADAGSAGARDAHISRILLAAAVGGLVSRYDPAALKYRSVRSRYDSIADLREDIVERGNAPFEPEVMQGLREKLAWVGLFDPLPDWPRPEWHRPPPPACPQGEDHPLAVPLIETDLPARLVNAAVAHGCWWVSDLAALGPRDRRQLHGAGKAQWAKFDAIVGKPDSPILRPPGNGATPTPPPADPAEEAIAGQRRLLDAAIDRRDFDAAGAHAAILSEMCASLAGRQTELSPLLARDALETLSHDPEATTLLEHTIRRLEVRTLGDLVAFDVRSFLAVPGNGKAGLALVEARLAEHGLRLGMAGTARP